MGLYGLPFEGIKQIRETATQLASREAQLLQSADALQKEVSGLLGWARPLSLRRVANNAYAPLIWRDMTQGSNRRLAVRDGLACELGKQLLASLPETGRRQLLDIEFRRIHLNHAVGLVQYELARLKRLEKEFDEWRKLMRESKPVQTQP